MDLKEFVAEAIIQIAEGIRTAQTKDTGAVIFPRMGYSTEAKKNLSGLLRDLREASNVRFDIAVTVSEQSGGEGKGGINVLGVKIGGGVSSQDKNETVSRIIFDLPVIWPEDPKNA